VINPIRSGTGSYNVYCIVILVKMVDKCMEKLCRQFTRIVVTRRLE